ncbi:TrkH family potassium uptake protein [Mesobacterium pallidum]|uniref:TrkH family potassium uptake protein n=1 Tax=Mesobacterium pallidum TaxID=2872037 RepID=UPI001EE253BF|nr:potassium transporter TrkG [Mesobacterium pallidum]
MVERLLRLPLFLILTGITALSMYIPAIHALVRETHAEARSFFYAGTLGLILVGLVALARGIPVNRESGLRQLLALLSAFTILPLMMAVPFHDALRNTTFLNAYVEMVSAFTTTGMPLFDDPSRMSPVLHLWRAQVGWMGGLLMWIAAAAILAPLNLGGFEVTASNEPGQGAIRTALENRKRRDPVARRLARTSMHLAPIYAGLTVVMWVCLLILGEESHVALSHAMSVMATSGISPVGGMAGSNSGIAGEAVMFCFMFFALSRLTFTSDTMTTARTGMLNDPEFRMGMVFVIGVPLLLFLRHWIAAIDVGEEENLLAGLRALWGSVFTVLSFLSTTGFVSVEWTEAQSWSGLGTPGLILLGLSLMGGGVATTAGGVKLLRVYALYLNGKREIERLIHPSSVGRASEASRRLRRQGAFIAWVFFMLFALSLTLVSLVLSFLGVTFEHAFTLAIATLSTTGPLIAVAPFDPIDLAAFGPEVKLVLCAAMVIGRLETLAIIALFTTDIWRS